MNGCMHKTQTQGHEQKTADGSFEVLLVVTALVHTVFTWTSSCRGVSQHITMLMPDSQEAKPRASKSQLFVDWTHAVP